MRCQQNWIRHFRVLGLSWSKAPSTRLCVRTALCAFIWSRASLGIGCGHLDKPLLFAPLRGLTDVTFVPFFLPQPRFDNLHLLDMGRAARISPGTNEAS